jgi:LPXTG-motif cell wall-anchored protein
MNKTLTATLAGTVGLLAAGLVALPTTAQATPKPCLPTKVGAKTTIPTCPPQQEPPVCGTWKARGATGAYPNITFGGKPAGTEISATTAKLTKPADGIDPGVEFAAADLDVVLDKATKVSVNFELSGGASAAAGAIRMFGYTTKGANTITDGPDFKDEASGNSGTLKFTVPAGKLGTLGLVYDASNNSQGAVTFNNLTIGDRLVKFTPCTPPTTTPTTRPTTTAPTTTPTTVPTSTPPSSTPPVVDPGTGGGDDADSPSLPVTGPTTGIIAAVAVFLIGLGGVAVYASRRKRQFEA